MDKNINDSGKEALSELASLAPEIAGSAAGALIGLTGGPIGAIIGGVAGPIMTHVIQVTVDALQRKLSTREKVRMASTIAFTVEKIEENINKGLKLRSDSFFYSEPNARSAAEEIAEGIIMIAQKEYEEKKLKYLGYLLANIAFNPSIDRPSANLLINVAEQLSYRQMCYLSLMMQKELFSLSDGGYNLYEYIYSEPSYESLSLVSLGQEIYDLYQKDVFRRDVISEPLDMYPVMANVSGIGFVLYHLAELNYIETKELEEIISILREYKIKKTENKIIMSDLKLISDMSRFTSLEEYAAAQLDAEFTLEKKDDGTLTANEETIVNISTDDNYTLLKCSNGDEYKVASRDFRHFVSEV
jgi:hypothetical protein